jgi:hypothetical protein
LIEAECPPLSIATRQVAQTNVGDHCIHVNVVHCYFLKEVLAFRLIDADSATY